MTDKNPYFSVCLENYYDLKYRWRLRATDFAAVEATVPRRRRITVFGLTQCGKTTLILRLIGIREDKQKNLGKLLRGNSDDGESCTASAIIYGKSEVSDKFGIREVFADQKGETPIKYLDETQFAEEISNVRTRMEKGEVIGTVYYYIPADWYAQNDAEEIEIIDLPGSGAYNEHERKLANDLQNQFWESADANLVVINASNIQCLATGDYRRHIEQYQSACIFVISYAFSDADIRNHYIQTNEPLDKVRDYYAKLLAEKVFNEQFAHLTQKENIFPLENVIDGDFAACPRAEEIRQYCHELIADLLQTAANRQASSAVFRHTVTLRCNSEHLSNRISYLSKRIGELTEQRQELAGTSPPSWQPQDYSAQLEKLRKEYTDNIDLCWTENTSLSLFALALCNGFVNKVKVTKKKHLFSSQNVDVVKKSGFDDICCEFYLDLAQRIDRLRYTHYNDLQSACRKFIANFELRDFPISSDDYLFLPAARTTDAATAKQEIAEEILEIYHQLLGDYCRFVTDETVRLESFLKQKEQRRKQKYDYFCSTLQKQVDNFDSEIQALVQNQKWITEEKSSIDEKLLHFSSYLQASYDRELADLEEAMHSPDVSAVAKLQLLFLAESIERDFYNHIGNYSDKQADNP